MLVLSWIWFFYYYSFFLVYLHLFAKYNFVWHMGLRKEHFIIISLMSGCSGGRSWVSHQFHPHVWVERRRDDHSYIMCLGKVDLAEPIPLQLDVLQLEGSSWSHIHGHWLTVAEPSVLTDDFSLGSPPLNDTFSLPLWIHCQVCSSTWLQI